MTNKYLTPIRIELARNGFLAYEEDFVSNATRPIPFVFETYESLQRWLKNELVRTVEHDTD